MFSTMIRLRCEKVVRRCDVALAGHEVGIFDWNSFKFEGEAQILYVPPSMLCLQGAPNATRITLVTGQEEPDDVGVPCELFRKTSFARPEKALLRFYSIHPSAPTLEAVPNATWHWRRQILQRWGREPVSEELLGSTRGHPHQLRVKRRLTTGFWAQLIRLKHAEELSKNVALRCAELKRFKGFAHGHFWDPKWKYEHISN
eukprot:Skav212961  [mRNA]  locus=scaffold3901:66784:72505:- [translate_table: standard]